MEDVNNIKKRVNFQVEVDDEGEEEELKKRLDAEDILLNKISEDMAKASLKEFNKHMFRNKTVKLLIPQLAMLMCNTVMMLIDNVMEGSVPIPDDKNNNNNFKNQQQQMQMTQQDAIIDTINITADMLKLTIGNKESPFYRSKVN